MTNDDASTATIRYLLRARKAEAELAAANTLIASYESPTCDHRHPCRCGSGGHPRRCERHPNAYDRHIVELNAIGKTEAEREDVEVRICTIADEAFGPFPVHSADEACTAIERGAFEQRARITTLERELAAARAVTPDVEASQPATVGGLLATHIKAIRSRDVVIECFDGDLFAQISYEEDVIDTLRGGEHHQTVHNYYAERTFDAGPWSSADAFYGIDEMIDRMNLPARLVSAEHADDSPATRGPIGEG